MIQVHRAPFSTLWYGVWILVSSVGFHPPARGQPEPLPSLDPGKAVHHFVHEVWQADAGLPNYAINDILQTSDGYLWLATHGGMVRFDGVRFEVFNRQNTPELVNSYVSSLHESRDGNLWIGSRGSGLLRYEGGRFTRLTTDDGLPDDAVVALAEDLSGGLWIATLAGVAYNKDGVLTRFTVADGLPHDAVTSLAASRDGGVWAGTNQGGLARFEHGTWTPVEVAGAPRIKILTILEDRSGDLWLGFIKGPLRRFDGSRWIAYPQIESTRVIYQDRAGTIWADAARGLVRLEGDSFSLFAPGDGLTDHRIYSLYEDREGSLWIGTYGGGLNRLKNGALTTLTDQDGLPGNFVHSIYEDTAGGLWMGTTEGLVSFREGRVTTYTTRHGLRDKSVLAILEDRDHNLWAGTMAGGLHRLDGTGFTAVEGAVPDRIGTLYQDRAGTLWIGTNLGLHRYEAGAVTAPITADGLPHARVIVLHEDRAGILWVGTSSGLARFEAGSFTTVKGLENVWIRSLHEDAEGSLWIGTVGEGLYLIRPGELTQFTVADGLPDDYVWDILEDGSGRLWMSSDQGIFRVARRDLIEYALGKVARIESRRYDTADGMKTIEGVGYVHPGAVRTRAGAFWFPTVHGAVRADPERSFRNRLPPPVAIQSVVVNDGHLDLPAASPLTLSADQRDLEIYYTGLSFRVPTKVNFRYRLEGYDAHWIDAGARRVAYYTNLPAGRFVFRVIAANEDGVWSETGASLELSRQPSFAETPWFYGFCVLLASVAGTVVYRNRTQKIRARNQHLNELNLKLSREAAERGRVEAALEANNRELEANNHELEARNAEMERFAYTVSHDLKAPLVSIQGFLGLLEQDARKGDVQALEHDVDVIKNAAGQMSLLLRDLLEYSRVGHVANSTCAVSLSEVAREATDLLRGQLDQRGVTVSVQPDMPIVHGDALRLREVLQNLVENAAKFAGDQARPCVEIGVREERVGFATCFVRDNGKGVDPFYRKRIFRLFERLDPSIEGTGVGLALVKRIVESHGGQIWVESEGDARGSTFCFTLPLASAFL